MLSAQPREMNQAERAPMAKLANIIKEEAAPTWESMLLRIMETLKGRVKPKLRMVKNIVRVKGTGPEKGASQSISPERHIPPNPSLSMVISSTFSEIFTQIPAPIIMAMAVIPK